MPPPVCRLFSFLVLFAALCYYSVRYRLSLCLSARAKHLRSAYHCTLSWSTEKNQFQLMTWRHYFAKWIRRRHSSITICSDFTITQTVYHCREWIALVFNYCNFILIMQECRPSVIMHKLPNLSGENWKLYIVPTLSAMSTADNSPSNRVIAMHFAHRIAVA